MGRKKKVFKWLPEQPCVVCGRMIPKPMLYCSSKCEEKEKREKRSSVKKKGEN